MQSWGGVVQRWGRKKNISPIPDYGDLMTIQEFISCVQSGGFIDYDGFGNYSDGVIMYDDELRPSDITKRNCLKNYSHIVWFNR